jgi:hypothetical protein
MLNCWAATASGVYVSIVVAGNCQFCDKTIDTNALRLKGKFCKSHIGVRI